MLDMAVFNSMAAHVAHFDYRTKDDPVAAVEDAWSALDVLKLETMWACKCVTMRQLVFHRGCTIKSAHTGLRKAYNRGGRAEMWAKVDRVCAGIDSCEFSE